VGLLKHCSLVSFHFFTYFHLGWFHLVTRTSCITCIGLLEQLKVLAWGVHHADLHFAEVQSSLWIHLNFPCILANNINSNGHVVHQTPKSYNGPWKACHFPYTWYDQASHYEPNHMSIIPRTKYLHISIITLVPKSYYHSIHQNPLRA
jgi:hypothetical protein